MCNGFMIDSSFPSISFAFISRKYRRKFILKLLNLFIKLMRKKDIKVYNTITLYLLNRTQRVLTRLI